MVDKRITKDVLVFPINWSSIQYTNKIIEVNINIQTNVRFISYYTSNTVDGVYAL